ncbi:unnamed protein product [Phytomonas sp. Hart1]|nr:unnamed protein product [Phytomonas sp. Hart1]|eukprot:CCW72022.1 unnamed protein product [Phytomonas sp. isolate Hart1]
MPVYAGDPGVRIATVRERARDGWELRELTLGSHTGTHVDAPVHLWAGGQTLDEIPLDRFCGPAVVVADGAADYPARIGLLFRGPVGLETVPGILRARPPFVGGPLDEPAERALLAQGIITYTDLVNLDQLVGKVFTFVGFPLKIRDGDGSPVRAVALVHDG